MRKIVTGAFVSLDGVMQAPGGPEEDTEGGFPFGGWSFPHYDEAMGQAGMEGMQKAQALLLGRKTYDIFAGYWPQHTEGDGAGAIGRKFDAIPKYVASRSTLDLGWPGTTQLGADAAADVARRPPSGSLTALAAAEQNRNARARRAEDRCLMVESGDPGT